MAVKIYDPNAPTLLADQTNLLAVLDSLVYLVRPQQALAYLIKGHPAQGGIVYTGDAVTGYLASVHGESPQVIPELIVHELPSGEIQTRIPLIQCPDDQPDCQLEIYHQFSLNDAWSGELVGGSGQLVWSPDGRHLAYAAVHEGFSDLFVYDTLDSSIQQMTDGTNYIGKVWWSPDKSWIIFEIYSLYVESLFAGAVDGSQFEWLYSAPRAGPGQNIVGWLDDGRFISNDGVWDVDFIRNLRLVDPGSAKVKTLLPGEFRHAALDPITGTIILYLSTSFDEDASLWPGYEGDGFYMLSTEDPTLRHLESVTDVHSWDRDLGMFVTTDWCDDNENKILAISSGGEINCIRNPQFPETVFSPDGRWQVVTRDGIWLQTAEGKSLGKVREEDAGQVIWCPDSKGFFLAIKYKLYHVSVPDVHIQLVDDQLMTFPIYYQWVRGYTD